MGYGALIVGHPIDINHSTRDYADALDDRLRNATKNELWLSGGEFQEWNRQYAMAFVCKSVSFLSEVYGGADQRTLTRSERENALRWLKGGLPNIDNARTLIAQDFPDLRLAPRAGLYLVMSSVNATTSTELFFGSSGSLSHTDENGWRLALTPGSIEVESINRKLANPKLRLTMDAYRAEMKRIGEDDDESFFYEYAINCKSEVLDILNRSGIDVPNIYDDDLTEWEIINGRKGPSLYKDTHRPVSPGVLQPGRVDCIHSIRHTG